MCYPMAAYGHSSCFNSYHYLLRRGGHHPEHEFDGALALCKAMDAVVGPFGGLHAWCVVTSLD